MSTLKRIAISTLVLIAVFGILIAVIYADPSAAFISNLNVDKVSSVVGLLVTVLGFLFTIDRVLAAQQSARDAQTAAQEMRDRITSYDAVAAGERVIASLDDLMELHRRKEWKTALDRYSTLKRLLLDMRSTRPSLAAEHQRRIQSATSQLTSMQELVERFHECGEPSPIVADLNKILTREKDYLVVVFNARRDIAIGE